MNPAGVKSSTYINFNKENSKEDPKFKIGDHVRISTYKNIFAKVYVPIDKKKFLWLQKVKMLNRRHVLLVILTVKKLLERFTKKICKKKKKKSKTV